MPWVGNLPHPYRLALGEGFLQKGEDSLPPVTLSRGWAPWPAEFLHSLCCWALCLSPSRLRQCPFSTLLFGQMSPQTQLSVQLHVCNQCKTLVKLVSCKTAELRPTGKSGIWPEPIWGCHGRVPCPRAALRGGQFTARYWEEPADSGALCGDCSICQAARGYTTIAVSTAPPCHED